MRPAQIATAKELRPTPAQQLPILSWLQMQRRCLCLLWAARPARPGRPGKSLLLQAAVKVQADFWLACLLVMARRARWRLPQLLNAKCSRRRPCHSNRCRRTSCSRISVICAIQLAKGCQQPLLHLCARHRPCGRAHRVPSVRSPPLALRLRRASTSWDRMRALRHRPSLSHAAPSRMAASSSRAWAEVSRSTASQGFDAAHNCYSCVWCTQCICQYF